MQRQNTLQYDRNIVTFLFLLIQDNTHKGYPNKEFTLIIVYVCVCLCMSLFKYRIY